MGVKNLLPSLPGGDDYVYDFRGLAESHGYDMENNAICFDAGSILFKCARRRPASYVDGEYGPSLELFADHLIFYVKILEWKKLFVAFDGMDSIIKKHEHERRQKKREEAKKQNGTLFV